MPHGYPRPSWRSRGWMSFTLANGAVLHLGGVSAVAPTAYLSSAAGASGAGTFLALGIPQSPAKDHFAFGSDPFAHSIKHAVIEIISSGATVDPAARRATDGATPTTALGKYTDARVPVEIHNSPDEIFNLKLFNRSGGNMVIEVEVFE